MIAVLCSECFLNEGLQRQARKLGQPQSGRCEKCGAEGGALLDLTTLKKLFADFFCGGSVAAAYLPPVFRVGEREDPDINLEQTANTDYELIKSLIGDQLRRHTPPLYQLGYTQIRTMIENALRQNPETASDEIKGGFDDSFRLLLKAANISELTASQQIYRARIAPENSLNTEEYDSPPVSRITPNRVASPGAQLLCGAFDVETCVAELKPHIDDIVHHKIFVATLGPLVTLKLVDFTAIDRDRTAEQDTLFAFFAANTSSYIFTQLLSSFVRGQGYDGVIYPSALSCIAPAQSKICKNVALFGAPLAERKLKVKSINRIVISTIAYDLDLGPAWDRVGEANHPYSPFMKGWINRVNWIPD